MSGALVGKTIYVAGGIATPDATVALKAFWALDLDDVEGGSRPPGTILFRLRDRARRSRSTWRELEPWPGRERMLATAGACDGSFFLFGGTALRAGPDGKPVREWLRDAYRYTVGAGWKRIADLPRVSVAAPSPAPCSWEGRLSSRPTDAAAGKPPLPVGAAARLLVIGGDDGAQVNTPPTAHKGFPRDVLVYDVKSDTWRAVGEVPFSLVTTTAVEWNGRIVIPGGEAKPGVRSPRVWACFSTRQE